MESHYSNEIKSNEKSTNEVSVTEEIVKSSESMYTDFKEIMKIAKKLADSGYKGPATDSQREKENEFLAKMVNDSDEYGIYSYRFFSYLIELSKAYQSELIAPEGADAEEIKKSLLPIESVFPNKGTIACQGVEGAYSGTAAKKLFPYGTPMYFNTFSSVFDAVESGLCKYGVLPIENSSGGSVRAIYDLLNTHNVHIVKSEKLCIKHVLLAKKGTKISDITEIHSHEQALLQCSKFLKELPGDVKIIPEANTAIAARNASESKNPHVATIASRECASLYGLSVISDDIQDTDNNYTRFICISKDNVVYPGADRISLILGTEHKPGALYGILSHFAALGINLVKLESYPIPGEDFEFTFFFEIEASVNTPGVLNMLLDLKSTCSYFKYLGNYSES